MSITIREISRNDSISDVRKYVERIKIRAKNDIDAIDMAERTADKICRDLPQKPRPSSEYYIPIRVVELLSNGRRQYEVWTYPYKR